MNNRPPQAGDGWLGKLGLWAWLFLIFGLPLCFIVADLFR